MLTPGAINYIAAGVAYSIQIKAGLEVLLNLEPIKWPTTPTAKQILQYTYFHAVTARNSMWERLRNPL
jgi:hypothetical protein